MATIVSPQGSFIQFTNINLQHCVFGTVKRTLPVYADDDVAFQFLVRGTADEITELAAISSTGVSIGLAGPEDDLFSPTLIEFSDVPDRFKLSSTEILYNWTHGFPGFKDVINVGDCFRVQIIINTTGSEDVFLSNDFERIGDDCFSSVIEYGSDDNGFGFNYCGSGPGSITGPGSEDPGTVDGMTCEPTRITFTNQATLQIPYTASLQAAYGSLPTVQAWIYDEAGDLVNAGISIKFDASPPTLITADFGGPASGVLIIK